MNTITSSLRPWFRSIGDRSTGGSQGFAGVDQVNTASGLVRDFAGRLNVDELPSGNTSIQFKLTDVEESPTRYIRDLASRRETSWLRADP